MENQLLDQQFDDNQSDFKPWGMDLKQFCMLMHLSQFASMVIPLAGTILPIVMWSTNKDYSAKIDIQGKAIVNWIITSTLIMIVSIFLCFVFIGFFLLIGFGIASIVFTIMGAVRADKGELYVYPMTINFIK